MVEGKYGQIIRRKHIWSLSSWVKKSRQKTSSLDYLDSFFQGLKNTTCIPKYEGTVTNKKTQWGLFLHSMLQIEIAGAEQFVTGVSLE